MIKKFSLAISCVKSVEWPSAPDSSTCTGHSAVIARHCTETDAAIRALDVSELSQAIAGESRLEILNSCMSPFLLINPLTPNDNYIGGTAPLTSKVAFYIFIQQI